MNKFKVDFFNETLENSLTVKDLKNFINATSGLGTIWIAKITREEVDKLNDILKIYFIVFNESTNADGVKYEYIATKAKDWSCSNQCINTNGDLF